ncbi:MAG: cell wall protein [Microbacterium sp.]|uniref:cell wall protein n=1 Tax=Microbacterium sp. TaxID=51671 RepID=UPI0039E217A6
MSSPRTALFATALSAALVLSAPAAYAATIYPPTGSCSVSSTTVSPGGTVVLSCQAATFSANETVTITVSGENGSGATIGMIRTAVSTASGTATSAADGSLPGVDITLPSNASGTYNIAAFSTSSAGGTAALTITGASSGVLSFTGVDSGMTTALLIGGGAVLLAGIALIVGAILRRRSRS